MIIPSLHGFHSFAAASTKVSGMQVDINSIESGCPKGRMTCSGIIPGGIGISDGGFIVWDAVHGYCSAK